MPRNYGVHQASEQPRDTRPTWNYPATENENRSGKASGPHPVSCSVLSSALGLNDRSFTLADRRLAFADAAREAEGQKHRADYNEELLHEPPHSLLSLSDVIHYR